jgi:hypothetical protein
MVLLSRPLLETSATCAWTYSPNDTLKSPRMSVLIPVNASRGDDSFLFYLKELRLHTQAGVYVVPPCKSCGAIELQTVFKRPVCKRSTFLKTQYISNSRCLTLMCLRCIIPRNRANYIIFTIYLWYDMIWYEIFGSTTNTAHAVIYLYEV